MTVEIKFEPVPLPREALFESNAGLYPWKPVISQNIWGQLLIKTKHGNFRNEVRGPNRQRTGLFLKVVRKSSTTGVVYFADADLHDLTVFPTEGGIFNVSQAIRETTGLV